MQIEALIFPDVNEWIVDQTDVCSSYTSGPVSAHLLANMETVAVGMTVAVLVFPLQCFLCFLFRKAHSQVI